MSIFSTEHRKAAFVVSWQMHMPPWFISLNQALAPVMLVGVQKFLMASGNLVLDRILVGVIASPAKSWTKWNFFRFSVIPLHTKQSNHPQTCKNAASTEFSPQTCVVYAFDLVLEVSYDGIKVLHVLIYMDQKSLWSHLVHIVKCRSSSCIGTISGIHSRP